MSNFAAGSVLGRYELLVPIARGGMADVWAARLHGTRGFTKLVAIKTIRQGSMDDTQLEQMFLYEAQLASLIQHPNVISTLELGEHQGSLFLAMEWADAEPVSYVLKETAERGLRVPLEVGVSIVAQACRGLHCAHELRDDSGALLGVVHRDVSPQNILVTYMGTVKLVDFGIAKATQRASSLTEDGQVRGKLAYMSPEQARGETLDRRSDVFAMGTVLYVLTTGQHPFKGANPGETLANLLTEAPVAPPRSIDADYPPALEAVVMKCVEKEREHRFATAEEVLIALEDAMPEARGIDGEVARFLTHVSGPRGEQRRQHIRAAGEVLDRSSEELAPGSQSPTSLSAVYLGRAGTHTMPSIAQTFDSETARALRRKPRRSWVIGGTVALTVSVLAVAAFTTPDATPATGPAAAGAPQPKAALTYRTDLLAAPPVTAAAPSPTEASHPPSASTTRQARPGSPPPATNAKPDTSTASPRPARAPQRPAPRPLAPQSTATNRAARLPEAAPTKAQSKPAEATPTKSNPKVDAWDPDSFGGRL